MVKRQYHKKYISESTDESDSDDFYEEDPNSEAQPKKYSLRQRKTTNFDEDFEYDGIEENDSNVITATEGLRSDDEDFDLKSQKITSNSDSKKSSKLSNKYEQKACTAKCTITKCQDRELSPKLPLNKQSSEDMIDFEDVIRADILVVNSKIDYDSVIAKSEIKIEAKCESKNDGIELNDEKKDKLPKFKKNGQPAKKRGRKPKNMLLTEEDSYEDDFKRQKIEINERAGLPINSVLGVTESLYELAERYHFQEGMMNEALPLESIINEDIAVDHSNDVLVTDDNEVPLQADSASETLQIH